MYISEALLTDLAVNIIQKVCLINYTFVLSQVNTFEVSTPILHFNTLISMQIKQEENIILLRF